MIPEHSTSAPHSSPAPGRVSSQTRTLVVAILASFMAILDGSVVNLALVDIGRDLGGGLAEQQWIVSGYLLSLGALILVAGSIADRFGRERVMTAGLIGFGVTSLACGLAPTPLVLVLARVLQGIAGAFLVPSSLAMIVSAFSGPAQGRAIGTWTAWTSVAGLVSPLVGGVLVDALSWRAVFFVNLPPMVAALLVLRRIPVTRPDVRTELDLPSAVLAALGLGGLVFGLIELSGQGPRPGVLALIGAGLAGLVLFVLRQRRAEHPMMPLALFRVTNVAAGNTATVLIYGAMGLGFFALPLYLQSVLGLSAVVSGVVAMPPTLLLLLGSGRVGRLSGERGPRWLMAGGAGLAACGYVLMGAVPQEHSLWAGAVPGVVVFGLGLTFIVAPLTSSVLAHLPPESSGIGSAINNAAARIAGLVTVAFAGLVMGGRVSFEGFRSAVWTTAGLLLAGAVVSALGVRNTTTARRPSSVEEADAAPREAPQGAGGRDSARER